MKLILVHEKTGRPAVVGEVVTTFRGEKAVLEGWSEPYDAELLPNFKGRYYAFPCAVGSTTYNSWYA